MVFCESKPVKEGNKRFLTALRQVLPAEQEKISLKREFVNKLPRAAPDMTQIQNTPVVL